MGKQQGVLEAVVRAVLYCNVAVAQLVASHDRSDFLVGHWQRIPARMLPCRHPVAPYDDLAVIVRPGVG
eukprot:667797-Hanusia_phi.AAC.1